MSHYLLIIIAVALISYPIRMIPAVFISHLRLSPYMQRLLDLVPYTALTALVFPGIFFCVEGSDYAAWAGTGAALLSSFFKLPLAVTVIIAVLTVLILLLI